MTLKILRYGLCVCEDIAVFGVWHSRYCGIGCVTVQILRYGLCDCADCAVYGV